MGGIKHHLFHYGLPNQDWNKIQDPIERDMAFRGMAQYPYCRLCGEPILDSDVDKNGIPTNWKYEMYVGAHIACIEEEKRKHGGQG